MGKGILFLHLNLLFKQYLLAVLFFILYKVVLTFETEVKILKCDNENCGMVLFCGARNYLAPSYTYYVQGKMLTNCVVLSCGAVFFLIFYNKNVKFSQFNLGSLESERGL